MSESFGSVHVKASVPSLVAAARPVGAGSSLGVAAAPSDAGPACPFRFSPRTLKVYCVPLVRPVAR